MNTVILVVLIVLTVLMTYKNMQKMKEYKKDKTYVDLYTKVLRNGEGVNEELDKYISEESDVRLNTKAKIVKAYNGLLNDNNPSEYLKDIDIKNIFYENGKFSTERLKMNSEIFVWLTLMLSKARCLSMIDLMNEVYEKVDAYKEDLKVFVEYQVFNSAYTTLLEKGTEGIDFLKQLLAGDYSNYIYDKNLIGIYKKIAACLLVFSGEPIDESDEAMLPEFTTTLIGDRFTKDLEIYDKYANKETEANKTVNETVNDAEVANEVSEESKEEKPQEDVVAEEKAEDKSQEEVTTEENTAVEETVNEDKKEEE